MKESESTLRTRIFVDLPMETMGYSDENVQRLVRTAKEEFRALLPGQCTMNNRYIAGPAHLIQTLCHEFSGFTSNDNCRITLYRTEPLEPLSQEIIKCMNV